MHRFKCIHCPNEFENYEDLYNNVVAPRSLNPSNNNQQPPSTSATQSQRENHL